MTAERFWVDVALYGGGTHKRFTQDSPILPDVWAEYLLVGAEDAGQRHNLLLEAYRDSTPGVIVAAMRERMSDVAFALTQTVYHRTAVSTSINFRELVNELVPLTRWYRETIEADRRGGPSAQRKKKSGRGKSAGRPPLPKEDEVWHDVVRPATQTYPHLKFLSFIRIAGVIAFLERQSGKRAAAATARLRAERAAAKRKPRGKAASGQVPAPPATSDDDRDEEELVRAFARLKRAQLVRDSVVLAGADSARAVIARVALKGWHQYFDGRLPMPAQGEIVRVNRNRPVSLALTHSVKTVKADAAARVFAIDCRNITWAIIDSGIDASHPAFLIRDDEEAAEPDPQKPLDRLKRSRVKETYDFSHLEDLLLGDDDFLSSRLSKLRVKHKGQFDDMVRRVRLGQVIDWQALEPFLRIPHDQAYLDAIPPDGHGTHVAGILGADWPRGPGDKLQGVCPGIRLIDMRVTREDGSSNEFIVMAALQFLRYMNANAEEMRVHGVNMSLSIPFDAGTYGCGQTPVCVESEHTVLAGMVAVAAAGNLGYRRFAGDNDETFEQYCTTSITDPGNADMVITVGSTHRIEPHTYGVSYFSSRGPTGDGRIKPDLVAPGEKIFAPTPGDSGARLDGTSMAAPHVSGAAATLMARHVELIGRPARIKEILCSSATDLGRERYFQGHGLVDILRALQTM